MPVSFKTPAPKPTTHQTMVMPAPEPVPFTDTHVVEPGVQLSQFAEQIDLAGFYIAEAEKIDAKIDKVLEQYKTDIDLANARREQARAIVEALTPLLNEEAQEQGRASDETFEELGARYKAEVGKEGNKREITDLMLAKKLLGSDTFFKVATIKLKDLDDYLTKEERKKVIKESKTPRKVAIAPRVV